MTDFVFDMLDENNKLLWWDYPDMVMTNEEAKQYVYNHMKENPQVKHARAYNANTDRLVFKV